MFYIYLFINVCQVQLGLNNKELMLFTIHYLTSVYKQGYYNAILNIFVQNGDIINNICNN